MATIFSRFVKIDWIADILTPLTIMLMEVFVLYPWLVFLGKWPALATQRTPLSLLSLICLFAVSFIANKFFLSHKWSLLWIQISIMICGLAAIFLVLRIEYGAGFNLSDGRWFTTYAKVLLESFSHPHPFILAIPGGFYLWWCGINLNRSVLSFASIYFTFLVGLGLMIFLVIIWSSSYKDETVQNMTSNIGIYVAGFFFFGLISLALSNLRIIQERMKAKGEPSKTFGRRWLLIISGIIAGIILISVSFASIFSIQFVTALGRILNSVSDVLYKILYYLFLPLGYLVEWLIYIGRLLINWLRGGQPLEPFKPGEIANPENLPEVTKGVISPELIQALKWIALVLALAVVVFLVARAIRRSHSRAKEEIEEEQESLWSWDGFKVDLKIFLNMLLGRFRRKQRPVFSDASHDLHADEASFKRLNIREIYQHLLWHTTRLGARREQYETPLEYAKRLERVIPSVNEPLNELTELYIDVRYGEHQVEEKKTDTANNIWQRLRDILRGLEGN